MGRRFSNPWSKEHSEWFNKERKRWQVDNESNNDNNTIKIKGRNEIIIVIDPGHGNTKGNTGAVYRKAYKHKVKDSNGEAKKDNLGNVIVIETLIENLPNYVKIEITKDKSEWKWAIKRISDNSKLERGIAWEVSHYLKAILLQNGYSAFITRNIKIIEGNDDRKKRNYFANNLNADYFISVHANGSYNFDISGAHTIYRASNDVKYTEKQIEFSTDIYKYYTAVSKNTYPVKDNGIQILSTTQNKSKRKTLVELGYVTNPEDYNKMTVNQQLIAKQLAKGLEFNITKIFSIAQKIITGYHFNGENYKTEAQANFNYEKILRNKENLKILNNVDGITSATLLSPQPIYKIIYTNLKPIIK